jgi:hypothetical protein
MRDCSEMGVFAVSAWSGSPWDHEQATGSKSRRKLDLWQGCHEIAEKSSKIVPLGAPDYSFTLNSLRRYPSVDFELRPSNESDDHFYDVPRTIGYRRPEGLILRAGGGLERIKEIINNALKQPKLSECLNTWIGPGTVLTNQNLPYLNGTVSGAELSSLRGREHVIGTVELPAPTAGRGTVLLASAILPNMDLSVRTYLHETANLLAIQQFWSQRRRESRPWPGWRAANR